MFMSPMRAFDAACRVLRGASIMRTSVEDGVLISESEASRILEPLGLPLGRLGLECVLSQRTGIDHVVLSDEEYARRLEAGHRKDEPPCA